jgi:hypothetical protein
MRPFKKKVSAAYFRSQANAVATFGTRIITKLIMTSLISFTYVHMCTYVETFGKYGCQIFLVQHTKTAKNIPKCH